MPDLPSIESPGLQAGLRLSPLGAEPSDPMSPNVGPGWVGLGRAGYLGLSGSEPGLAHHYSPRTTNSAVPRSITMKEGST